MIVNPDEVFDALEEWRDAREAFWAVSPIPMDPSKRFPAEIWTRMGHAEHRLMELARKLRDHAS